MFEPGHLHVVNMPGLKTQDIDIHLRYEIRKDSTAPYVHFDMEGEIDGNAFRESFELPRDAFYNFASNASTIAAAHGLHARIWPFAHIDEDYDAMFEDIRKRLNVQLGDPVSLSAF